MNNQNVSDCRGMLWPALLLLSAGWLGTVWAQTNATSVGAPAGAAKPIMRSRVFQWSEMQARPSAIGTSRGVFDAPTATLDRYSCHVTTLDPGKAPHPPHRHPEEELVVIKEGTLEVMQNGVTNQVSAGGMVFCASNELHGWRNSSPNPVTYYVIEVYPHDLPKAPVSAEPASNK